MATVTVKSKFGQFGTVDSKDLDQALKHGFAIAPNDEIEEHNSRIEHGSGMMNPAITAAESFASIPTFGLSRELENLTGLTTPEDQAARAKYNPVSKLAGEVGGFITPLGRAASGLKGVYAAGELATEGMAKVLGEAAPGAGYLARVARAAPAAAAGAAVEGAAFGAGQSINEHALGDPDALGEHLVSNIGYGALLGGAGGAALESGAQAFGRSTLTKSMVADAAKATSVKNDIVQGVKNGEDAGLQQEMAQVPLKNFPESIEDIQNAVKTNFPVVPEGVPALNALKEAEDVLPDSQFKTHNLQYESLKDQAARDFYGVLKEADSPEAKALRDYEAMQKSEASAMLDKTIQDIHPNQAPISEPVKAGESAIESFSSQYDAEKKELVPVFKKFDDLAKTQGVNGAEILANVEKNLPEMGSLVQVDEKGKFILPKYESDMPFSKTAYKSIKDLVNAANKKELTLSGLRNVRDSMKDKLNLLSSGRDFAQVGTIRKALMDSMEGMVTKLSPDIELRDAFKRYAVNEGKRDVIEQILGGSISGKGSLAKQIKPEDVLNKIFSNTVSVQAAKGILGKDFNKVLSDYLANARSKVTDEARNGFSSNKFNTFLRGKNPELAAAFGEGTPALKRIEALTTKMRILPDAPSVNPSGTAKALSIQEKIAGLSRVLRPTQALQDFADRFAKRAQAEKQNYTLGEVLNGKSFADATSAASEAELKASKFARLQRMADNVTSDISKNAKALFDKSIDTARKSVGLVGSKLAPKPQKNMPKDDEADLGVHSKVFAKLQELQDPINLYNDLEKSTGTLDHHAPMVSQAMKTTLVRATQFLHEKLPSMPEKGPFTNDKYLPSLTEIAKFERYYKAIEDPVGVMADVKSGFVAPEAIETLTMVYPKLYDSMKMAVMDQASKHMAKNDAVPYKTRLAISAFLNQAVDRSLDYSSIMANQQAYALAPQPQGQTKPSKPGMQKINLAERSSVQRPREEV